MTTHQFRTHLQSDETSAFFLEIPSELIATMGKKKRPPVRVSLNGYIYRTTVAVYGDKCFLPVRREIREAAGLSPGDAVAVTISLDEEPRVVEIPDDLERALAADPEAKTFFEKLSFSHRREYVAWITDAKREETRLRRLEQAIGMLREGRKER